MKMRRNLLMEEARKIPIYQQLLEEAEKDPWYIKLYSWYKLKKWILYCFLFNNKFSKYLKILLCL